MIEIVEMTASHVSGVAALEKAFFSCPWSENSIAGELHNPLSCWLVAVEDGKVAGYIGSQYVAGEADILNLAVDAAYRRCGLGTRLLVKLCDTLVEKECCLLTLEVRVTNLPAQALYRKLGFEEIGRRPRYYEKPREDALIFRKELRP